MNTLPDWLEPQWQRLIQTQAQGRLPHALLIIGQTGVGKRLLAERLAAYLLCRGGDVAPAPCGQCQSCNWLQAGTHPDLLLVEPEDTGKAIKVDQVRKLSTELGMTSHAGGYKIAIIQPADAMNVNAANSLLKTLEEPTANTLLILLSAAPGKLPSTIISRCQQLQVPSPSLEAARGWLENDGLSATQITQLWSIARGAPLTLRGLADADHLSLRNQRLDELAQISAGRLDPLKAAADWVGDSGQLALSLAWWAAWLGEIIRWQQSGRLPDDPELVQKLQRIVEKVDCTELFGLSDRIAKTLNTLGSGLNQQMQLEDLLIDWAGLVRQSEQPAKLAGR